MFEVVADVLGYKQLEIVPTGGYDPAEREREQWNDGNNVLALSQGSSLAMIAMTIPTLLWKLQASKCWQYRERNLGVAGAAVAA